MIFRKIIILTILLLTISCNKYWYKPLGKLFDQAPKAPEEASYGFRLGWIHGCESGLATNFAGVFYMTFYKWKRDPDLAKGSLDRVKLSRKYKKEIPIDWNNDREVEKNIYDYNTIFWRAHQYCRHYALGSLRMSGMEPDLPGRERVSLGSHDVTDLYRLDGFGDTRFSYW